MNSQRRDEAIAFLRRAPVLAACRDGPKSRRELAEETNSSRTTVYRSTVELEAAGLIENRDGGYRTTPSGGALSNLTETYLDGVDAIDRLAPLFEAVSSPELLEHAHTLTDVVVTVVDSENPYRVAERSLERFEAASEVRGVVASASPRGLLESAAPVIESKEKIEWLFADGALDAHDTVGGRPFQEALDAPHVSIGVVPDDAVPFTFSVDRDDLSISGHDPTTGLPTVIVESESRPAWRWLDERFESLRNEATSLEQWLDG